MVPSQQLCFVPRNIQVAQQIFVKWKMFCEKSIQSPFPLFPQIKEALKQGHVLFMQSRSKLCSNLKLIFLKFHYVAWAA